MYKFEVTLSSINDVKEFVNAVSRCRGEVDLVSGRYTVDAKSIMGIFSLDLTKPIACEIREEEAPDIIDTVKKFVK